MLFQPVGIFSRDGLDAFIANKSFPGWDWLQHVCPGFSTERAAQFRRPRFAAMAPPSNLRGDRDLPEGVEAQAGAMKGCEIF
jgi:hypothetical protein